MSALQELAPHAGASTVVGAAAAVLRRRRHAAKAGGPTADWAGQHANYIQTALAKLEGLGRL